MDESGIIKSRGRIENSSLSKHPKMLCREDRLTLLIVKDCHDKVKHRGVKQTLAELRSEYWINRAKSFVKKILRSCVTCKRIHGRAYSYPPIPSLPPSRLVEERPFKAVGIDHCGPLFVKAIYEDESEEITEQKKSYITLYTCASTRGIVLDVVRDTSAIEFIDSLLKFICRRGCPSIAITDNGTAFRAAETQSFAVSRNICWKFNVTNASWTGGFFERLVACVKNCLKKTVGKTYCKLLLLRLSSF